MDDQSNLPPLPSSTPQSLTPKFGIPQAIFSGLVIIAVSIYISFGMPNRNVASVTPPPQVGGETRVKNTAVSADDDPVLGEAKAPVTIIEFSDFQCPFCRKFWRETLPEIKKNYIDSGQVKLVYRDFPLPMHPAAEISAEAGECADDQGKFWDWHDKLFSEQDKDGESTVQYEVSDIKKWGNEIGLNTSQFTACLDSQKFKDEVAKDVADGQAADVAGTPMFFVNGTMVRGSQPFSNFQKIIDEALKTK